MKKFSGGIMLKVQKNLLYMSTLLTFYRSYFKDISANFELQVYNVTCC
jgi:hypothetical protein